ncbi:hypothetical protein [Flavobacterium sp.]|uniref:hypothetical protein n=1 Tax=Flavobacterium sp. TaxID=239 RepID=UPI00333F7912
MKKILFTLFLVAVVVSSVVVANNDTKKETSKKAIQKPLTAEEMKAARKKWEATPDGIAYKKWENAPEGKKVNASYEKVKKHFKDFRDMEAVVTSVTFQRENAQSGGPKWLILEIEGETYMMQFIPKEFEPLKSLKVNDKILVRSRSAGFSHNHPYLILSGDYIAKDNKVLFKRVFNKNNHC